MLLFCKQFTFEMFKIMKMGLSLVESVLVLNLGGGGVNLKVLIASVDILSCIRTAFSCTYLFEMISRCFQNLGKRLILQKSWSLDGSSQRFCRTTW